MTRALLFPGQGSQKVGMGQALASTFPEARRIFDEADAALGFSITRLCFDGPASDLTLTANTQPAILAMSMAAYHVAVARGLTAEVMAGHSLGEWSALCAAGAISIGDAVRCVRLRGQAMQEAVPVGFGAMAAIMGLDASAVRSVCEHISTSASVVEAANFNGGGQVVVSGHADAVERAMPALKEAGAKRVIKLDVSAPFHCRLMQPAADRVAAALAGVAFARPTVPIVCNVTAAPTADPEQLKANLVAQVTGTVRWEESVQTLLAMGVDSAYELGPGAVLKGLVKRIAESVRVVAWGDSVDVSELGGAQ